MTPDVAKRFWAKVRKTKGCWHWTAGCDGSGNPAFKHEGKQMAARRFAYEAVKVLTPREHLEPTCRNVRCVRPAHMRVVGAGAARHHHATIDFWQRVDRSGGPNACWLWQGACFSGGRRLPYGKLTYVTPDGASVTVGAHRFAWEQKHGPVPPGKILRHITCHNPPCVNPRHMTTGTNQDNANDAMRDGTLVCGERHPNAKLSLARLARATVAHAKGTPIKILARRFKIHRETLGRALRGVTWKQVALNGKPAGVVTRLIDFSV